MRVRIAASAPPNVIAGSTRCAHVPDPETGSNPKLIAKNKISTGTSAKLACLYADGKLRQGGVWRQESLVGSVFEGSIEVRDEIVYPRIKGSAFISGEGELVLDPRDPFCNGIGI